MNRHLAPGMDDAQHVGRDHYPTDIWSPAFVTRFGRFARAVAALVKNETGSIPFYVPVNEISFWAWGGGSLGYINPPAEGRGNELKAILVQAAIEGIEAVRSVDPRTRIVHAEPATRLSRPSTLPIYPSRGLAPPP